jgi:hypothetical protein
MRGRLLCILLWAVVTTLGCEQEGSSDEITPANTTPTFAGSCNFDATKTCDEFAAANADSGSAGRCTAAGGAWAPMQCPLTARAAVCLQSTTATRTYAYTPEAAAALASTCPAGQLHEIEGACTTAARGICDEFVGSDAVPGLRDRCESASGMWTSGGKCAMEARTAQCKHNRPASITYAYTTMAADTLRGVCATDNFASLVTTPPPPPPNADEDGGV